MINGVGGKVLRGLSVLVEIMKAVNATVVDSINEAQGMTVARITLR